ncbi:MAG: hypothetical protein IPM12_15320 [Flavobacteriales bacterium]|nr:hypothetical protein [Flavobacteriales bacterium]
MVALLWVAIWNGYPLVYSDTSTYLSSGFVLDTPIDRPITYGVFLRLVSLNGVTLWTVVLAQALLLAVVLHRLLKEVGWVGAWSRAGGITWIALVTGLPFSSGQLITDVFTPILLCTLYLLLWSKSLPRREIFGYGALLLVSYAMHMSHIGLTAMVLALASMLKLFRRSSAHPSWKRIALLVLIACAGTVPMGPSLAKSKNTFYAARMAEHGVLQQYLVKYCDTDPVTLCKRREIIPASADSFLWAKDSPQSLYTDRSIMESEFGRIRSTVLTDPELLMAEGRATLRSIAIQLTRFAPGDGNGAFGPGTLLHERLVRHVPMDANAYSQARQMHRDVFESAMPTWRNVHEAGVMIGLAALVLLAAIHRLRVRIGRTTWVMIAFLLGACVLNSAVNAGLVTIADRFGIKMAWAIPFAAMIGLYDALRRVPLGNRA